MLYDFQCASGHTFEATVKMGTTMVPCTKCTAIAKQILGATPTTFVFNDTAKRLRSAKAIYKRGM